MTRIINIMEIMIVGRDGRDAKRPGGSSFYLCE